MEDDSRILSYDPQDDDTVLSKTVPGNDKKLARISISGFLEKDAVIKKDTAQASGEDSEKKNEDKPKKEEKQGFRPLRNYQKGSHRFGTLIFLDSSIRARTPLDIIPKPDMITESEWFAVHATLFFNQASVLYLQVQVACREQHRGCRNKMMGGSRCEYLFSQGKDQPQSAPAYVYVKNLFVWLESCLDDVHYFPIKDFAEYPGDFIKVFKTFVKRIFRIFAHLNYAHRDDLMAASLSVGKNFERQLDDVLIHFLFFIKKFKLMEKREFDVMRHRYDAYLSQLGLAKEPGKRRAKQQIN